MIKSTEDYCTAHTDADGYSNLPYRRMTKHTEIQLQDAHDLMWAMDSIEQELSFEEFNLTSETDSLAIANVFDRVKNKIEKRSPAYREAQKQRRLSMMKHS